MPPTTTQQCGTQHFQYSMCTGRKKALCIGINYRGTPNVLKGCVNDAKNVRSFLIRYYEYRSEDIVLLTDDGKTPRERPTRQNMIDAMKWLVRDARPHDSLVFHYSGHGAQIRDRNGDEVDGYDELVFPLDHKKNGHILDDEMHEIMVKPLPSGCRLTAIFDSCHSGSALGKTISSLITYSSNGSLKEVHAINESGRPVALSGGGGDVNRILRKARLIRQSPADVISWSGCKDSQTSADTTTEAGNATGAMSYAFTSCLKANQNQSYQELLVNIREILRRRYKQKPQLSSSHPIDTNLLFIA
ncbi:peptidase C14 [Rickenella mellea]|uniref:Peptidase C14 n=1 Tax=Rickenella mellea TaxID=50990 RepID=A0A4Y7PKZ1_9AGAM|nr:peptidase C14 [Rickenella mellea]